MNSIDDLAFWQAVGLSAVGAVFIYAIITFIGMKILDGAGEERIRPKDEEF